jgi:predicted dehydrogenase
MTRIGVIGAGRHAMGTHGPALRILQERDSGALDLAAICDLDREKAGEFARRFGFRRIYASIEEMLAEEQLDALFAITPLPLTESIAAGLLPHGIPLLIEKPPGTSAAATARLLTLARQHGTRHMVSFNRRFNPAILAARRWIDADPNRKPRSISGRMLRHARLDTDFAIGTGIHLIDAVLSFLDRPISLQAARQTAVDGRSFSFTALVRGVDQSALLSIAPAAGLREETIEICGDDYTIKIDTFASRMEVFQRANLVVQWTPRADDSAELLDVIAETEHFLKCVRSGAALRPDLADALVSMQAAEAIQGGGNFCWSGE